MKIRFACAAALMAMASSADAYLFWTKPDFSGAPVRGDEPGITLPLPNATATELNANLIWNLRAALNVAALQCQFSTPLMVVRNYNGIINLHEAELARAYKTLDGYFRRTKAGPKAFDSYTTKTYNGFSTMHAQLGFCETAALVGKRALAVPRGMLGRVASESLRELRNSLIPRSDWISAIAVAPPARLPSLDDWCWKREKLKKKCEID